MVNAAMKFCLLMEFVLELFESLAYALTEKRAETPKLSLDLQIHNML